MALWSLTPNKSTLEGSERRLATSLISCQLSADTESFMLAGTFGQRLQRAPWRWLLSLPYKLLVGFGPPFEASGWGNMWPFQGLTAWTQDCLWNLWKRQIPVLITVKVTLVVAYTSTFPEILYRWKHIQHWFCDSVCNHLLYVNYIYTYIYFKKIHIQYTVAYQCLATPGQSVC